MAPTLGILDRRRFLQGAAFAGTAATLAACGAGSSSSAAPAVSAEPPATPSPAASVTSPNPTLDGAATVLVKDVVEFELRGPYEWNGGSVTMRLHEGWLDGQPIYFVRTDASDEAFASEVGLVFAQVLRLALEKEGAVGRIFLFGDDAADGQVPVLSTGPGRDDFTPLYRVNRVTFTGDPALLDSAAAVDAATADSSIEVEETDIVVNYPAVKWPGGELPVDTVVEMPLEGGPLLGAPDLDTMVVTFKLHQCFPESRYIVTDTSAVPMAPMMNIQGFPGTTGLAEEGAASTITAIWKDETKAVLLTSQAELDEHVAAGEIEIFKGTPDTDGQGFVVNCPSPVVAPNDFAATT